MQSSARLKEYFDSAAEIYEGAVTKAGYFSPSWITEHMEDLHALNQCRVLDLACGTGLNVKTLCRLRQGIQADGIDISTKMLDKARESGLYGQLSARDLGAPISEIAAASYDLVIAFGFLEFLADINVCLSECQRVLAPNGTLWASLRRFDAEDEGSPPRRVSTAGMELTGYSADEIPEVMGRAGLTVMGVDAVTGYITHKSFCCPFWVVRARKSASS